LFAQGLFTRVLAQGPHKEFKEDHIGWLSTSRRSILTVLVRFILRITVGVDTHARAVQAGRRRHHQPVSAAMPSYHHKNAKRQGKQDTSHQHNSEKTPPVAH
jgi:hypothetical protein